MSYTELWRCKRCNILPDIVQVGKHFHISCKTCNSRRTTVFADSLDDVVRAWNNRNDPRPGGLFSFVGAFVEMIGAGFGRIGERLRWRQRLREEQRVAEAARDARDGDGAAPPRENADTPGDRP